MIIIALTARLRISGHWLTAPVVIIDCSMLLTFARGEMLARLSRILGFCD
jgi:hypothetical protein